MLKKLIGGVGACAAMLVCVEGMFCMQDKNITYYAQSVKKPEHCLFACDVGGTNTRCALVELGNGKPEIVFALRVLAKEVGAFTDVIEQVLAVAREKYTINVTKVACAIAGFLIDDKGTWRMPNVPWTVDKETIINKTTIKDVVLINDFEALGYIIDVLTEDDVLCLNPGITQKHETRVVIGAGTGLGKCIVAWNPVGQGYSVIRSEGHDADFVVHSQEELFLQKVSNKEGPLCWEDVLSGRGISALYQVLMQQAAYAVTDYAEIIKAHNYDPAVISRYKDVDQCCKKTFEWFSMIYGRAIKDFVLETRALGGVYIAGGIAKKNIDMFKNEFFMHEFLKNQMFKDVLKQIPLYVILNQDAGLLGAAQFARLNFISEA